jgi:murein DD-endopeptidase MepM/ murein hydrolase activator NlpD
MGETGQTDGAHLHFEIRVAGQPIDAAKMLQVASRGD